MARSILPVAVAMFSSLAAACARPVAPPTVPTRALTEPAPSVLRAPFVAAVHGLAVGPDRTVYFSDSFRHARDAAGARVERRSVYALAEPYDGAPVRLAVDVTQPAGLQIHGDSLVVCDLQGDRVLRVSLDGAVLERWPVRRAWNTTGDSRALFAVTYDGSVVRLEPGGSVTTLFSGLDRPFGIAAAGDGSLWVSEQGEAPGPHGRVTRRALDGSVLEALAYAWENPEGLAVDERGRLWIAETELGRVLRRERDGSLRTVHEGLAIPIGVTASLGGVVLNQNSSPPRLLRLE